MKTKLLPLAISAAVAAAGASMTAQAGTVTSKKEDLIVSTDSGIKVQSADKQFSFDLGGRIQLDFTAAEDAFADSSDGSSTSQIEFRRLRLAAKGTAYGNWGYKIQLDFEDGSETVDVEDAYISYKGSNATWRFGQFIHFSSLERLTSSNDTTAIERTGLVESTTQISDRRIGVGYLTTFADQFNLAASVYEARATQGGAAGGSTDGGDLGLGYSVRGIWSPVHTKDSAIHFGISYAFAEVDGVGDFDDDAGIDDTNLELGPNGDVTAESAFTFGLEAAAVFGPTHIQVEYLLNEVQNISGIGAFGDDDFAPFATDDGDFETQGVYIQLGHILTGESRPYDFKKGAFKRVKPQSANGAWEVFGRVEFASEDIDSEVAGLGNADGGEEQELFILTAGINWYINNNVRSSLNYVFADVDAPVNGESDGNAIVARLQYAF